MEPNLDFVTERIAIGGDLRTDQPEIAEVQLQGLLEAGITHLVDCRREWSDLDFVAARAPALSYLHNGTDDDGLHQPDWFFDRGVDFSRSALEAPDSRILLHCHMGINRGPSLGYAVLLDQGHDPIHAIEAIRRARPQAVVGYAIDALDWHLRSNGTPESDRVESVARLTGWMNEHLMEAIRLLRRAEDDSPSG